MRIVSVELENVKSYKRADVAFKSGTNAICGQNGSGKSTLLEAIGFVLFDHLAVTQEDFVRRGEKTATITVAVEAGDGRVYEIVRRCGSRSAFYVHDPELVQRMTDGKAETMLWLQDFLGMEPNADLATLFRDAVGVPQGLLTAAFLETPSRRKDVFNPLLRVDEYEQAWSGLREPQRWLELQVTEQEKLIAGLQGQVVALPGARHRAALLSAEIEKEEQQREKQAAELEDVTARLTIFDEAKSELDALNQVVSQAEVEIKALKRRQEDVSKALAEAEAARDIIEETQEGFRVYESTRHTLTALESDRAERDRLQENLRALEKDLALTSQRLADLNVQLEAIEAAQKRAVQLEPKVERQTELEEALDKARLQADRLENARRSFEDEERRLAQLESQMERLEIEIQEREAVERELSKLREDLADVEADREDLAAEVSSKETEHARLNSERMAAEVRLREMRAALAHAEQSLEALRERESEINEGLKSRREVVQALSEQRGDLERLGAKIETITADQAAHRTTFEQTEARIAALKTGAEEEAVCPVCGQTLTPGHREELLATYGSQLARCREALDDLKSERDALERKRRDTLAEIRDLEVDLQTLPRSKEAEELVERIIVQKTDVESHRTSVEETRGTVSRLASQCEDIKSAAAELQEALDIKTELRTALQDEVVARDSRLGALPRPAELDQLHERITVQASVVEAQREVVTDLSDAPDRVVQLNGQLESLGDPRRDYQRARDTAERRPDVIHARDEVESRLRASKTQVSTLEDELEAYSDVDARIEAERSALNQYEEDHRRYVAHLRQSEALEDYRETYRSVKSDLSEAKKALEATRDAQEGVRAAYDPEAHATASDMRGDLRESLAALKERVQQRRGRLAEIEVEIDRLQALASEMEDAENERNTLQALQNLLGYLRGVLREAGPVITRRLVDVISLRADRLYREIMQDYTTRLRWTEDYDIILKQSGRERSFQQLSGGEQMAAALAVRLALLQEISTVGVAFFDEPTANLDDRRRDNLAEQILGIQGFNQLFVISHDDTFEQDTDHVIRVRKVDGVSHVEV